MDEADEHFRTHPPIGGPPDDNRENAGVHFRCNQAVLSGSASVPIDVPRPWDIDAIGSFNLLF